MQRKKNALVMLLALLSAPVYSAEPTTPPPATPAAAADESQLAEKDYNALVEVLSKKPARLNDIFDAGTAFYRSHPSDKRVASVLSSLPFYGRDAAVEEKATFRKRIAEFYASEIAKPALPTQLQEVFVRADFSLAAETELEKAVPDAKGLRAKIDALTKLPLSSGVLTSLESSYARVLDKASPGSGLAHVRSFVDQALAQPDVTEAKTSELLLAVIQFELQAQRGSDKPDLASLRARLDTFSAKFPTHRALSSFEISYAKLLAKADPKAGEAFLKKLAGGSNQALATQAAGELRVEELRTKPFELKFKAVDGREVDVSSLRGKVVLIDFWATWCGPCLGELPNLKRVYAEYHDKGFEVVGISFDKAPTPGKPAKYEKDAEGLKEFLTKEGIAWPQYYDGTYWDNPIGRQYNIRGIPALFLLNKKGLLVESDARGEKLEPLVKKLLAE